MEINIINHFKEKQQCLKEYELTGTISILIELDCSSNNDDQFYIDFIKLLEKTKQLQFLEE